jgi:hypothetical protein
MYIPGEAINYGNVLESCGIEPGRGGSKIYAVRNTPSLFARNATKRHLAPNMPSVDEDLAEALFRLPDEYGLEFPGIGCLVVKDDKEASSLAGHTYTTLRKVDGFNMHEEMSKVPYEVTTETVDKILSYYEDMSQDFSSRLYLADLSLRQCIFGVARAEGAPADSQPRANFVDYDRRLSNISRILFSKPFANFGEGFGGIAGLDDDLYALKANYPQENFDQIAQRLLNIANQQGIFYKVPTAYDHVNDLQAGTV